MTYDLEPSDASRGAPPEMVGMGDQRVPDGTLCKKCGHGLGGLPESGVCPECATPIAETIGKTRGCIRCGYDLTGLPATGICPECALPVERSLRGDQFRYADPAYVQTLYTGAKMVIGFLLLLVIVALASIPVGIAAGTGAVTTTFVSVVDFGSQILSVVASLGMAYGWWKLSEPNPAAIDPAVGSKARSLVRVTALVNAGVTLVSQVLWMVVEYGGAGVPATAGGVNAMMTVAIVLGLVSLVVFAVAYFSQMKYLQWVGPRLPDGWVTKRARLMMWLGPVLYVVGALCIGLGPLVALILYYNLITKVRADLKKILEEQEREAIGGVARS